MTELRPKAKFFCTKAKLFVSKLFRSAQSLQLWALWLQQNKLQDK